MIRDNNKMKNELNNRLIEIILIPILVVLGFVFEHLINHAQAQSLKQGEDNEIH